MCTLKRVELRFAMDMKILSKQVHGGHRGRRGARTTADNLPLTAGGIRRPHAADNMRRRA